MSQSNSYEQEVPENTKLCMFYIIRIKPIHKYINNDLLERTEYSSNPMYTYKSIQQGM